MIYKCFILIFRKGCQFTATQSIYVILALQVQVVDSV